MVEVEIQTQRHFLHHLRKHSAEPSLLSNDKWKPSNLERLVARSAANCQLLHPAKHSQLDRLPTQLHQLHKLRLGPVNQL